ncbi:nitric oxide synthase, putative [Plasmodium ovale]|uniref:NADPH--hemoprotein reductase n=2 Tax=Plasmodium ovale TaxID=36330 RepID=A0A1A8VZH9_PLAOA|nr:NADPH-cytochrome p450 reductase, putative (CPR) [Plasmodium ovale curtisi]SCQ16219.1 nitric oxide synthase, putative [Plasmodium ovale]
MYKDWKRHFSYALFFTSNLFLCWKLHQFCIWQRVLRGVKNFLTCSRKKVFINDKIRDNVKIYFGSQGGTAEQFAKELSSNFSDLFNIKAEIIDLEYFNKEEIKNFGIRIFIVATYGDGEPTDNAIEFFKWLKSLNNDNIYFLNTKYSVMGLGSKQYKHFNKIAKKLTNYLTQFKAEQISETIYGDDDDNIYHDFEIWKNKFFKQFSKFLNLTDIPLILGNEETVEFVDWIDLPEIKLDIAFEEEIKTKETNEGNTHTDYTSYKQINKNYQNIEEVQDMEKNGRLSYLTTDITGKFYFNHHTGNILSNKNLLKNMNSSSDHDKVNHITISTKKLPYKAADTLVILPKNADHVTTWWLNRLNINEIEKNKKFTFVRKKKTNIETPSNTHKNGTNLKSNTTRDEVNNLVPTATSDDDNPVCVPFPTPCSIEEALSYYCDLTTIPRVNILKKFKCFIKDIEELKMFNYILSNNQRKAFFNICKESDMTFLEFVDIFMHKAVFELSPFLQLIPKNNPKSYTISSSPKEGEDTISITVKKKQYPIHSLRRALKSFKNKDMLPNISEQKLRDLCKRRWFKGAASFYLTEELNVHDTIRFNLKTSKFVLPHDLEATNIIMIATGTGIAPFKAFITEFNHFDQACVKNGITKRAKRILFFGCRKKEIDFLYEKEIIEAQEKKHIDEVHLAFSRDQYEKIYVQDLILEKKELVWNLIQKGAYIYVCGNNNMSQDVKKTINSLPAYHKQKDKKFTKKLKKAGRYIEEMW